MHALADYWPNKQTIQNKQIKTDTQMKEVTEQIFKNTINPQKNKVNNCNDK